MVREVDLRQGSALIIAIITSIIIIALSSSAIMMATTEQRFTYMQAYKLKSRYMAEAGLCEALSFIEKDYMGPKNQGFTTMEDNIKSDSSTLIDYKTVTANGGIAGQYKVATRLFGSKEGDPTEYSKTSNDRYILISAYGYYPDKDHPRMKMTVFNTVYKASTVRSKSFEYAYFIHNWGWLFNNKLYVHGNTRTNGTLDIGAYSPKIIGRTRYADIVAKDDGSMELKNPVDSGGLYAWNNITGNPDPSYGPAGLFAGLRGNNPSVAVEKITMPTLADLDPYIAIAKVKDLGNPELNTIQIGGTTPFYCDGVWGDNSNEKQHLYLEGTYDNPIKINGTVVVKGDLILRGYIEGQGTIYCGRNIYLPQRLLYKNPPNIGGREATVGSTEEQTRQNRQSWVMANKNKDMVTLFASENILIGNVTAGAWKSVIDPWLNSENNKTAEDAGEDGVHNTDDPGEDDHVWTPLKDGNNEPIAGTGEDTDGDGEQDYQIEFKDLQPKVPFSIPASQNWQDSSWGGNIPASTRNFTDLTYWNSASTYPDPANPAQTIKPGSPAVRGNTLTDTGIPQIDGVLFSAHVLGGSFANKFGLQYNYDAANKNMVPWQGQTWFYGSMICQNEALVDNCPNGVHYVYDDRLLTGNGLTIPKVWNSLELITMTIE